ncbi:MAG: hypothetical protein AAGG75_02005 [Bacteroidota bacterium]
MKTSQLIILTTFLVIGFSLPSCNDDDLIPDCNCENTKFFDVNGLLATNFQIDNGKFELLGQDSLSLEDLGGLMVEMNVDYHALVEPRGLDWSFSLMNTADACSCLRGYGGSKTERLVELSVITLNDFDDAHPANSNINDILTYGEEERFTSGRTQPLADFLAMSKTENLMREYIYLKLDKAPTANPEFHYLVRMELSTGEVYEAESVPLIITP